MKYDFEALTIRHAPLPADVQLAFVHSDELSLNPFLSEQAAAALLARKPKLPGKLAERMARQPGLLTADLAFTAICSETRLTVLDALAETYAHMLDDSQIEELLSRLPARRKVPSAAVRALLVTGRGTRAARLAAGSKLDWLDKLEWLASLDPADASDDEVAGLLGDGSFIQPARFNERKMHLRNIGFFRPGLVDRMLACDVEAFDSAAARLPLTQPQLDILLSRDERAREWMFRDLVWNKFVSPQQLARRDWQNADLADTVRRQASFRAGALPADFAQLSDDEYDLLVSDVRRGRGPHMLVAFSLSFQSRRPPTPELLHAIRTSDLYLLPDFARRQLQALLGESDDSTREPDRSPASELLVTPEELERAAASPVTTLPTIWRYSPGVWPATSQLLSQLTTVEQWRSFITLADGFTGTLGDLVQLTLAIN